MSLQTPRPKQTAPQLVFPTSAVSRPGPFLKGTLSHNAQTRVHANTHPPFYVLSTSLAPLLEANGCVSQAYKNKSRQARNQR